MRRDWSLPALSIGELAPDFNAPTRDNPKFHFSTVAGRHILLGFLPDAPGPRAAALAAFETIRPRFDDANLTAFLVSREQAPDTADRVPGQRWFFDSEGKLAALYTDARPDAGWFLIDPALRLLDAAPLGQPDALFRRIAALPPVAEYAGVPLVAPVLILPRVYPPELCRELIAHYEERGGKRSGVMRDIGGKTVGVLDSMKSRRDVHLGEGPLQTEVKRSLEANLVPMLRRVYQFRATRLERYLIACYDAQEGGYFRPHRDNETLGTAHRRFAVSINLNAEDFEGGDLRFPEFGPRTYRPPTGGAVVFACNLQHEATPVTRGRRYAFLPFFYDEAGHEIRERNLTFLEGATPAASAPPGS